MYQPKPGAKCSCRRGVQRDNCPNCEGTGLVIDFKAIRGQTQSDGETLIKLLKEAKAYMDPCEGQRLWLKDVEKVIAQAEGK